VALILVIYQHGSIYKVHLHHHW